MRCENPVKIVEILRLRELGLTQQAISASVNSARSTVAEVLKRSQAVGLTYEKTKEMSGDGLRHLLYPAAVAQSRAKSAPDFKQMHEELQNRPNLNLKYLWTRYIEKEPEGLGYSQFCERYNQWGDATGKNVIMHQERDPAKEMFVDWMGVDKTMPVVVDPETGEMFPAHFFVSAFGNSGMPFAIAYPDERIEHWLQAHVQAFLWYGGLPRLLVPDNCRTGVKESRHYDPVFNPSYLRLSQYYELAIVPARIRKPQDKSVVEESVRWLETWLVAWLSDLQQPFDSFEMLNSAVQERVEQLAHVPFQKRAGTRESIFVEIDMPVMRPLPARAFELEHTIYRTVPNSYHVECKEFEYSVPYTYFRRQIMIRFTCTTVEILCEMERIASHPRRYIGSRYVTDPTHMPEHHRHYWEQKQWNGARFRDWAGNIGADSLFVIDALLSAQKIEEQAYKSCMGILQLTKKYGNERLERACAKARKMDACAYRTVKTILENGQEGAPERTNAANKALPPHENIRGAGYYS